MSNPDTTWVAQLEEGEKQNQYEKTSNIQNRHLAVWPVQIIHTGPETPSATQILCIKLNVQIFHTSKSCRINAHVRKWATQENCSYLWDSPESNKEIQFNNGFIPVTYQSLHWEIISLTALSSVARSIWDCTVWKQNNKDWYKNHASWRKNGIQNMTEWLSNLRHISTRSDMLLEPFMLYFTMSFHTWHLQLFKLRFSLQFLLQYQDVQCAQLALWNT